MNITLKLISRKGTFEEHEFPKTTFAGIEELYGIRLVYTFMIGIISRNLEYFLITNQVKSVIKIFRQILEGSPAPFHILRFYEWGCSGIPIDNNLMTALSSK
jgi:hypothetical protein